MAQKKFDQKRLITLAIEEADYEKLKEFSYISKLTISDIIRKGALIFVETMPKVRMK